MYSTYVLWSAKLFTIYLRVVTSQKRKEVNSSCSKVLP